MKTKLTPERHFYLVATSYAGPNPSEMRGSARWLDICTEPGVTNQSGEPRVTGWLGTTNDWSKSARGEFSSLVKARAGAARLGFSEEEDCTDDQHGEAGAPVERYHADDDPEIYPAGDWLDGVRHDLLKAAAKPGATVLSVRRALHAVCEFPSSGDDTSPDKTAEGRTVIVDGDDIDAEIQRAIDNGTQ